MNRILITLLAALLFSAPLWGQDAPKTDEREAQATEEEAADTDEDPLADLDEQGYGDEDEDDFVPTEEIPYDQDIPFPTDI